MAPPPAAALLWRFPALLACAAGAAAWAGEGNGTAILGLLGHPDAAPGAYTPLLEALQAQAASVGLAVRAVEGACLEDLQDKLAQAQAADPAAAVFLLGHGMVGGADALQDLAPTLEGVAGLVLLGGFLRRDWRPSVVECKSRWAIQPSSDCPEGKGLPFCLGGYLPDGAHACPGPEVPAPVYPVPTLTLAGDLDGVVRVARIAEAWYTQRATPQHAVVVLEGLSHSTFMASVPEAVAARDLPAEVGADAARAMVSELLLAFLLRPGHFEPVPQDSFFRPFVDMFVRQEGSWWWTSNSEEHGSSAWVADAQPKMAAPMPEGFDQWNTSSEFHMLSDEENIPPYFRSRHRPSVSLAGDNRTLVSSAVAQLRYVKLSVAEVAAGLNGWALIKEEKAGVLSRPDFADDGGAPVAALEIGAKLVSRQEAHAAVGAPSPPESLDDGDRCRVINQAAIHAALAAASPRARSRYERLGRRLTTGPDRKPFPPAGPWWIWNYLTIQDTGGPEVEVRSWYAFYPLSGPAYGAGNHYCKLLSPAWALEWIYTDSLRRPAAGSVGAPLAM